MRIDRAQGRIVVVMGVSASGKTSVATALAERIGARYLDADDLHPEHNVAKMRAGIPLTDEDRLPWLYRIRRELDAVTASGSSAVLACSALKRRYRDTLREAAAPLHLVYLRATREDLRPRLARRRGHFFPAALLDSQFAALEEPAEAEAVTLLPAALPLAAQLDALCTGMPTASTPG